MLINIGHGQRWRHADICQYPYSITYFFCPRRFQSYSFWIWNFNVHYWTYTVNSTFTSAGCHFKSSFLIFDKAELLRQLMTSMLTVIHGYTSTNQLVHQSISFYMYWVKTTHILTDCAMKSHGNVRGKGYSGKQFKYLQFPISHIHSELQLMSTFICPKNERDEESMTFSDIRCDCRLAQM